MQLLIPFASGLSEAAVQVARDLPLPQLGRLLGRLQLEPEPGPVPGPDSFSPPHERALARHLGWSGGDGCLPFGAWRAGLDGLEVGDLAWAECTPCHWHAGRDQVTLADPAALALDEAAARTCFDAVRPLFVDEGFALEWGGPMRWYLAGPRLAGLRTASIDRVIGRDIGPFLPYDADARLLRRLQQEVQMLLYQHPQHDARVAAGLLPMNSFWVSGCGPAQPTRAPAPEVLDSLRGPALQADWTAWAEAWQRLDAGPLAEALAADRRGKPVRITLCGERSSVTLLPPAGRFARLRRRLQATPDPGALLVSL